MGVIKKKRRGVWGTGLVCEAHRRVYHSILGWRAIKKKKKKHRVFGVRPRREIPLQRDSTRSLSLSLSLSLTHTHTQTHTNTQALSLSPPVWSEVDLGRSHPRSSLVRRVQGAGFRVQGAGCRVQGAGCRVRFQGPEFRVQGAG